MTWLSSVDLPSQLIVGDRLFSYQPTLQNRFQCLTIPSSDLITAIHDESRILSHPITQRLEQTQSRLRVDYPDKDRFFVFCYQILYPIRKTIVILQEIIGVFLQDLIMYQLTNTRLVEDLRAVRSMFVACGYQREDFQFDWLGHRDIFLLWQV